MQIFSADLSIAFSRIYISLQTEHKKKTFYINLTNYLTKIHNIYIYIYIIIEIYSLDLVVNVSLMVDHNQLNLH